ncbi:fimbrillin family protein, partial [Elizabethkingia anophelis]|uniref:fimbrillin family protein n=1 Tax=Elizabethkingia anophelis TaxID=1117645 RepID=UPI00136D5B95
TVLTSCRADDANSLSGVGVAAVKINLLGADYSSADQPAKVASLNPKGITVAHDFQRYTRLLSPSSYISAELAPSIAFNKVASTSKNFNAMLSVSGDPLGAGVQYRVIAYRESDGSYQTHQDYTIGQPGQPMMLDGGVAYHIVVYSYGTESLPAISEGEQGNISSSTVNYADATPDLMYQKVNYTPDGNKPSNVLNITLRHQVAQITMTINSNLVTNGSIQNITAISNAVIAGHSSDGSFSLNTGLMSGRSVATTDKSLDFPSLGFPGATHTARPVFVNADTGGRALGGFSADITIAGTTKTISLPNSFKITPGSKSNLTMNFRRCGAYTAPDVWKEFACHNLGADTSLDPFTPAAGLHGDKYQWGIEKGEAGRYVTMADDQFNPKAIPGWKQGPKPNGSWSGSQDVCTKELGTGWRLPTKAEWEGVINETLNPQENKGDFTASTTNYTSGKMYGPFLFLPATGLRGIRSGALSTRGSNGLYWS